MPRGKAIVSRGSILKARLPTPLPPVVIVATAILVISIMRMAFPGWLERTTRQTLLVIMAEHLAVIPDSPDEMAFDQLRVPISITSSSSYVGSGSRVLTDATGERRNRQFRQHFRGLWSYRPNPSGESGPIRTGQSGPARWDWIDGTEFRWPRGRHRGGMITDPEFRFGRTMFRLFRLSF